MYTEGGAENAKGIIRLAAASLSEEPTVPNSAPPCLMTVSMLSSTGSSEEVAAFLTERAAMRSNRAPDRDVPGAVRAFPAPGTPG